MQLPDEPRQRKHMKRREVRGGIRFITFSTYRRTAVLRDEAVAEALVGALVQTRREHGFELFAWVVMPEHVHLLVRPAPDAELADALKSMKLSVSQWLRRRRSRLEPPVLEGLRTPNGRFRLWQPGGGFDRNVRSLEEFCREVRYVHRNPVERGLVGAPEEWRWSSVRWWMGAREGEVECDGPPEVLARWTGYV